MNNNIQIASMTNEEKILLSARFTGDIVFPEDSGFEDACLSRVFNARRPNRQPAAVLFVESENDIVEGVRLANEKGWQVAIRSGGHSWAAWSVRDQALLIDIGSYKEISYDSETGIVSATPCVKGGDELNPYLANYGRFFNGGHCPSVGIGGFLLQGGMGWNCRGWGWAAESIVAIDVVTAEGNLVRADEHNYSDLFWAARGAGPGFFGVVTKFHLHTRKLPSYVAQSVYFYPIDLFDVVMSWLLDIHESVSKDVEIVAVSMTPTEEIPGHLGDRVFAVTGVALVETEEQAKEALAPLGTCPILDRAIVRIEAEKTTMAEQLDMQRKANPEGHRYIVDNAYLEGAPDAVVSAMRGAFVDLPNEKSFTIFFSMAPLRKLPDMALSMQSEMYIATYTVYEEEENDRRYREWLNEQMRNMEPVTKGQYLGDSDLSNRQVKFMEDSNWNRLLGIWEKYDPKRVFVGYLATDQIPLNTNYWDHNETN
jgi:FAD/FMN-containing dehydrogenase